MGTNGHDKTEEKEIKVKLRNLGTVNKNMVTISRGDSFKQVRLYFSYETLVAVDDFVSVNDWSRTTGKLLNELCRNKKARVEHSKVLKEAQERIKAVLY